MGIFDEFCSLKKKSLENNEHELMAFILQQTNKLYALCG